MALYDKDIPPRTLSQYNTSRFRWNNFVGQFDDDEGMNKFVMPTRRHEDKLPDASEATSTTSGIAQEGSSEEAREDTCTRRSRDGGSPWWRYK